MRRIHNPGPSLAHAALLVIVKRTCRVWVFPKDEELASAGAREKRLLYGFYRRAIRIWKLRASEASAHPGDGGRWKVRVATGHRTEFRYCARRRLAAGLTAFRRAAAVKVAFAAAHHERAILRAAMEGFGEFAPWPDAQMRFWRMRRELPVNNHASHPSPARPDA